MERPTEFEPDQSRQPDQRQLQLVVHAGPLAGKGYPITSQMLTFGRDPDNDITLDDNEVSRHHARLLQRDDEIILEDLGSTNGTLVNGRPITGQHVLQPADIISIGSSVFGVRGFAAPATMGVVGDIAPEDESARWIGVIGGGTSAGFIIGPVVGGLLYDSWGYGPPFLASIGLAVLTLLITFFAIPETRTNEERRRETLVRKRADRIRPQKRTAVSFMASQNSKVSRRLRVKLAS